VIVELEHLEVVYHPDGTQITQFVIPATNKGTKVFRVLFAIKPIEQLLSGRWSDVLSAKGVYKLQMSNFALYRPSLFFLTYV
jgi:hypothetical protein